MHPSAPTPTSKRAPRLRSLDGLRGLAALIVLVHHSMLTLPGFADPYYGGGTHEGVVGLLNYSPLHLVWAGTEAVYLFFVLSGLVLALSVASPSFRWVDYVPRRLARLYLPVFGAILLAWVSIQLVSREGTATSRWLEVRPDGYSLDSFVSEVLLLDGDSRVVSPLWSLHWEVLFSLLLPIYIFLGRRLSLSVQLTVAFALVLIGSYLANPELKYLAMFAVGTSFASHWDRITSAMARFTGSPRARWWWALIVLVALLAVSSRWLMSGRVSEVWVTAVSPAIALAGVGVVVLAAVFWPPLRTLLSVRPVRWLGTISFSLYLIHEPIIVAFAFATDGAIWAQACALVVSLVVAQLFFLAVEKPAHRLSRTVVLEPRAGSRDA